MEVVNLEDKFARFSERWSPKIIACLNDYHVKAIKLQGEFVGTSMRRPTSCSS